MANRVSIGVGLSQFPFSGAPAYWRWIDLCEAGALDSIWQTDRLIGERPYLECLTAMAAVAGRTRRLKFGMNVLSLAQRDPVLVAKQCATIDMLSEGRLLPAFGIGSERAPEWDALGLDRKNRGAKTDEALEIIRRLWSEDNVDFPGQHFRLSGATITPKPAQTELPIWIGGASDAAVRRTARFGTGWIGGIETPALAGAVVARIRAAVAANGRTIDNDHYGAGFPFRFGTPDDFPGLASRMVEYRTYSGSDPAGYFAIGDAATIIERLADYVQAGVYKFILSPLARDDADYLHQTRRLIDEVLPLAAVRWPH